MKRMACNNSRWKVANQSKDLWIRRRMEMCMMIGNGMSSNSSDRDNHNFCALHIFHF